MFRTEDVKYSRLALYGDAAVRFGLGCVVTSSRTALDRMGEALFRILGSTDWR